MCAINRFRSDADQDSLLQPVVICSGVIFLEATNSLLVTSQWAKLKPAKSLTGGIQIVDQIQIAGENGERNGHT